MSGGAQKRVMWGGFLTIFVWGSIAGLLGAILPALRERAALTLSESSTMFIALSLGLVASSLFAGPLIDRLGKKPVLTVAATLVVCGLIGFEFVNALTGLLALAFVMGTGGGALVTGGHALIADLNPDRRSAALNLLDLFFGLGAFATPFAIVPLQRSGGIGAVLFVLAGLAAIVVIYLATLRFPEEPRSAHAAAAGSMLGLLANPAFLGPALLVFLYVGTEQSIFDWQVTYFMRQLQIENVEAARLLSVFPVAIMIGRFLSNRLLLRIPAATVLTVSTIGATLAFGAGMVVTSPFAGVACLFLAGLFMASIFPTTLGIVSGRFPEMSGTALGLAITCGWLGSVALSPAFGFVAHHTTFSTAYLVIVAGAAAMAAVVVVSRLGAREESRGNEDLAIDKAISR